MAWRERLSDLRESAEERLGYTVERTERLNLLESRSAEAGALRRELDALAWTALDYAGGSPQELRANERRKLAQKSRVVWMKDPQAGAANELMNDFVFGSGLAKPKAADPLVQEVIDEAWEDPDNELVLTSYAAQLCFGTDLNLQSNHFLLMFADGDDGKVKLGVLEHDTVENVVRDPDNRLRIMYFVARHYRREWDFQNDTMKVELRGFGARAEQGANGEGELRYYEHWRNVELAQEEMDENSRPAGSVEFCPPIKLGDGKVYPISINKTTEMAFGHPVMDRLLRWFNAYNRFIDARMDMIEAKAAFIMKRKIRGTPNQLQKQATNALSRRGVLGSTVIDEYGEERQVGPKPASILDENDSVTHEAMDLDTGASSAVQDAQMIRAQVSAATRFPQSYYGDSTNSNLATATSLELPVLKAVENRQEIVEGCVRWFVDRVIERAVDTGRITEELSPEEVEKNRQAKDANPMAGEQLGPDEMTEAYEDQGADEVQTQRDLSYEFSMPNPLKRMMADLITGIQLVAQTFDPNNTNMELSRTLLTIALGEALEVEDPAGLVEKIFPKGYVDPAVAMAQQMGGQPGPTMPGSAEAPGGQGEFAAAGPDGKRHPPDNAYGAPKRASAPGEAYPQMQQAVTRGRDGRAVVWLQEGRPIRHAPDTAARATQRHAQVGSEFDEMVDDLLAPDGELAMNGNGRVP